MVLTRPSYQGAMKSPAAFRSIISFCHSENIPVIVDEAHGAHIRFLGDDNMQGLQRSSDIAIISTISVCMYVLLFVYGILLRDQYQLTYNDAGMQMRCLVVRISSCKVLIRL